MCPHECDKTRAISFRDIFMTPMHTSGITVCMDTDAVYNYMCVYIKSAHNTSRSNN